MEKPEKLYKYRSLEDFSKVEDILVKRRLWASYFNELNDPKEGIFYFADGDFVPARINQISNDKQSNMVCSLSEDPENDLMWTFYANKHRGIVIEVELEKDEELKLHQVNYISLNEFKEQDGDHIDAKYLLTRKTLDWQYEKDWRVLTDSNHVKVKVTGIIKGERADPKAIEELEELIRDYKLTFKIKDRKPVWLGQKK
jgi:hypothetical protein